MDIRRACKKDLTALIEMALYLWPDEPEPQVRKDLVEILASTRQMIFICLDEQGKYIGFIIVSTRREYVSGATTFPVGYVEGIFVKTAYRLRGIGRQMFTVGEKWAAERGCKQIASDTWLWNLNSQEFHNRLGFMEKERLVTYIKRIDTDKY